MKKVPKYMEIYIDTKKKIIDEFYGVGDILPSGKELAEHYNTSKITIKKSLDMLVSEGVLYRRSGLGTRVIRKPITNSSVLSPNEGLFSIVGEEHVQSTIHTFSIELPSKKIQNTLEISEKEYVYNIIRSRYIDKKPYSIEQTYMPLSIIPGLEPKHLEKSIYNYIRTDLELEISSSHVWIKGDTANSFDSKILHVPENFFIIQVEKLVSSSDSTPFEYSISRHVYDEFQFEFVFVENNP